MPGRNVNKVYIENNYYHVYNRGLGKMDIFKDDEDFRVFLNLLKRTLGSELVSNPKKAYDYPNYHNDLSLLCYCLMPNHFHLLIKTGNKPKLLAELMKSMTTTYVMYFNKKYDRQGPLFGGRYRAVRITDDTQLWHITRYIHLNPTDLKVDYTKFEYSSIKNYIGQKSSDWLKPDDILDMFKEHKQDYMDFLREYESKRAELKEIKSELY